jgi:hypothetical protein
MRSASGVDFVSAVLQNSLARAQRRFTTSNPASTPKRKLLKERRLEQKFQRKLRTLSKENRVLSSTKNPAPLLPTWDTSSPAGFQAQHIQFEPADDEDFSFITQLKAKYTCLNPKKPLAAVPASPATPADGGKKRKKKLRRLLRRAERESEKEPLLGVEKEEDADSGVSCDLESPPKNRPSLLQLLRQRKLEARKEKKRLRKMKDGSPVPSLSLTPTPITNGHPLSKNGNGSEGGGRSPEVKKNGSAGPEWRGKSPENVNKNGNGTLSLAGRGKSPENGKKNGNGTLPEGRGKSPGGPEGRKAGPCLPQPLHVLFPRERVLSGWRNKLPVGAGFLNLGNSCYMNATLQALFHTPAFVNWLLNDEDHGKRCRGNSKYQAKYQLMLIQFGDSDISHSRPFSCFRSELPAVPGLRDAEYAEGISPPEPEPVLHSAPPDPQQAQG